MKKSLIALAALAATGAFAQSTVTLYGLADIGYTSNKKITSGTGTTLGKQTGITDGGFAGNRIGFRGTEDLGGGLKANFVVEQGMSTTNGALFGVRTGNSGLAYDGQAANTGQFDPGTGGGYTQATNRQSFVGIETKDMGTVRIGYQYTSLYEVSTLSGFSMTSEGIYGAGISHTWGAGAVGGTRANGITYISPRFNGFEVSAQIGSAGGRGITEWGSSNSANGLQKDKQDRKSAKLDYTQGPLRAAVAQTNFTAETSGRGDNCNLSDAGTTNESVCTFNVLGGLTSVNAATISGASKFESKLTQVAGSYNFGVAKLGATYNTGSKKVSAVGGPSSGTTPSAGATTALGAYDFNSMAVSVNVPVGALQLVASFGTAELKNATTTLADYKQNQVGAVYALSKRTNAYMYSGSWKNAKATTATAAAKGSQAIFGLSHSF